MSFDQWRRLKYSYYTAHAAEIAVRPGALEAWRIFEQSGLRQALVSNSDRIVVNANIRVLGLETPGFISVSINDVVRGKPDPEPYERAATFSGLSLSNVLSLKTVRPEPRPPLPLEPTSSRGRRIGCWSSRQAFGPSPSLSRRSRIFSNLRLEGDCHDDPGGHAREIDGSSSAWC